MAPNAPSSRTIFLPSQAQAALALAVIRFKPAHTSVRDYVLQLRAQIRRGSNPVEQETPEQYFDLVAYWQEQCRQHQNECDRLRNINTKLERSNHQLSSRVDGTLQQGPSAQVSKRKAPMPSATRPPKRPKRSQLRGDEPSADSALETVENDASFLELLGDDGLRLTEVLFTTHNLCRATNMDAEMLCSNLVRTSSALSKIIRFVAHNYEELSRQGRRRTPGASSLDQDKSDFATALSVCARVFMFILVGIGKIIDLDSDHRLASLVIYELVEMFKSALQSTETSAKHTAQTCLSQTVEPKKSKSKAAPNVVKESVPARAIAHLLISFLGFLEKTDPGHQKIFDGFVFVLLERVGRRLYYCTFGRNRSTSIEGNITPLPEPRDAADIAKNELEALAIRLEIRALILILERAIGLAPNHMNPRTTRATKTPNRHNRTLSLKNLPTTSRARLSPLAKDRLQRTLLACMYGHKADDEFLDVLTKSVPAMRLSSVRNVAKIDDQDVEKWYKEEVWRLIGWDILARESGW